MRFSSQIVLLLLFFVPTIMQRNNYIFSIFSLSLSFLLLSLPLVHSIISSSSKQINCLGIGLVFLCHRYRLIYHTSNKLVPQQKIAFFFLLSLLNLFQFVVCDAFTFVECDKINTTTKYGLNVEAQTYKINRSLTIWDWHCQMENQLSETTGMNEWTNQMKRNENSSNIDRHKRNLIRFVFPNCTSIP